MYTQKCVLNKPNIQDIRMLSEFGYKALESGVKIRKPKKYLYTSRMAFGNSLILILKMQSMLEKTGERFVE